MRTTLNLDDHLAAAAKREAARRGETLTSLLEEGLRAVLAQVEQHTAARAEAILAISRDMGSRMDAIPDPQELLYDESGLPR